MLYEVITAADGTTLRAPDRITLRRDVTFDDSQVLAKAQEEALLYRDMDRITSYNVCYTKLLRRAPTSSSAFCS